MTLLINDFRMDYSESCPEAQADEFERPPYKNPQHAGKAFDMLNLLRKQNLLCKCIGFCLPLTSLLVSAIHP